MGQVKQGAAGLFLSHSPSMTFTVKPVEREVGYRVVVDQRVAKFTRHMNTIRNNCCC